MCLCAQRLLWRQPERQCFQQFAQQLSQLAAQLHDPKATAYWQGCEVTEALPLPSRPSTKVLHSSHPLVILGL